MATSHSYSGSLFFSETTRIMQILASAESIKVRDT